MKPLLVSFIFSIFCFSSISAKVIGIEVPYTIQLSGYDEYVPLTNKSLFYWENVTQKNTPLTDYHFNRIQFKALPNNTPNFGFIQHDVWFQFSLRNNEHYDQVIYLSLNNPNLDHAELFLSLIHI
jgi:hypothetical protein